MRKKTKKTMDDVLRKYSLVIWLIIVVVPYFFISRLNTWQMRWFFGLILHLYLPAFPLYFSLNPKIRMTLYDPKELPKNRYILRHLGIVFRVFLLLLGIGGLFLTSQYIKSSYHLASNGWQPERLTGTFIRFEASGQSNKDRFMQKIILKETDRELEMIYPFGVRLKEGLQYEFFVLPDTDIVVAAEEVPSENKKLPE